MHAQPDVGPSAPAVWVDEVSRAADQVRLAAGGLATVLDVLVTTASSLLDASVLVGIVDGGLLVCTAGTPDARGRVGTPVDTVGTLCGQVLGTGRAVRATDALADPGGGPDVSCCPGARSVVAVPLTSGAQVIGVVCATAALPDWFDALDEQALVALVRAVAEPVAAALPASAGPSPRLPQRPAPTAAEPGTSGLVAPALPGRAPVAPPVAPPVASAAPAGSSTRPDPPGPALSSVGLWQWDRRDGELSCSAQVGRLLGLVPGERLTLDAVRDALHPDDLARFDAAVAHQVRHREPVEVTVRVVHGNGEVRHVQAWSDLRLDGDRVVGAFGGLMDVTSQRTVADSLRDALVGLHAVRGLTGAGLWEWRPGSGELLWSAEMFRLAGLEPGAIRPTLAHWHQLVHPEDVERARRLDVLSLGARTGVGGASDGGSESAGEAAPDGRPGQAETFRVVGADGVLRYVQGWSTTVLDGDSGPTVHGAVVEVTRQVRDRMQLDRLAATDPVTGLDNRLAFERRIKELLADPSRDVALLLLDLDRFKVVNDTHGHQLGDRLLVEVARRLAGVVPGGSITARMGGDEFVVPRPGIGWVQVRRLAQAIVEELRLPYVLPGSGEVLVCPVSVGVTCTSGREVTDEDLLSEADLALYQAKDSGRDRYVVFDDALRARARARHRAEQLLRSALEDGRLVLQYQPVVDVRTGRLVGAEALVRIEAADGRLVLPDAFIDVAEDTGLVVDLDCWVIDRALDQLAHWWRAIPGGAPWLAVNVSARSMEHPRVVRRLLDGLQRRALPTSAIKVELTERSFLGTLPGGDAALRQLLASGVPVGIDDFGTGYSALAYLQRFELDFMKIDRSFLASVGRQRRADAVVTAIVDLAHAHGMQVTAEGIEDPVQARRLAEIGCDFGQGFHVGRPVAAKDLPVWLTDGDQELPLSCSD